VPEDRELRATFASIGIRPGQTFTANSPSPEHQEAIAQAMKQGGEATERRRNQIGKDINGRLVGAAFGNRAFYKGDYELRAAAALPPRWPAPTAATPWRPCTRWTEASTGTP
jgi:hypothetical protein